MTPGASIELASRLLGRECSIARPITVDQTNYSVVVDEAVVVKWLRPPVPVPHAGVQLIRHLASAGFDEMPEFVGIDERDHVVHAIVTSYLPAALDGWDWYVDDVERWLADELTLDEVVESGSRMAAMTARLHTSLADLQPAMVELGPVADQAMTDLQFARTRLDGLEWLEAQLVADVLQPLRDAGQVPAHRIHGDLHAGQFLRAGTTMLITDFDGNPMQEPGGRSQPQSPLRDVASLVQSIEHVGSVVVKRRRPDRRREVDWFSRAATGAALAAYTAVHAVDLDLLLALRIAEELHEYAYSIHHLPHWRYVADDALPGLLGLN